MEITIKEGNKIIQIWLGLPTTKKVSTFISGQQERDFILKYHEDWNLLMHAGAEVRVKCQQDSNTLQMWTKLALGLYSFNKEKTWEAIIECINYFNSLNN